MLPRRTKAAWLIATTLGVAATLGVARAQGIHPAGVAAGSASFATNGHVTTITAANNTIINYSQFNVAHKSTVDFIQPSADSRVLNRILSTTPAKINGTVNANGIVYFVDPAGIVFGPHSIINVGQLYAAAGNMQDTDFLAGRDIFATSGTLTNRGAISSSAIYLIGQQVANLGSLQSTNGLVAMVSGNQVTLMRQGENILVQCASPTAPPAGSGTALNNSGTIDASGGSVNLTAGDLYSLAIQNSGTVKAANIALNGGSQGTTLVTGQLDASNQNGQGGQIQVLGDKVGIGVTTDASGNLTIGNAALDASGTTGGGTILIGGNEHGAGPLQNASDDFVAPGALINASATDIGPGGEVVFWSNDATQFFGTIQANGGPHGGDGGFIETSSHGYLNVNYGAVSAIAGTSGKPGTWLLDPTDVDIVNQAGSAQLPSSQNGNLVTFAPTNGIDGIGGTGSPAYVLASQIENDLANGISVTIATTGGGINLLASGNIDVQAPVTVTYNAGQIPSSAANAPTLILNATNSITIESVAGVTVTNGPLNVSLNAGYYGDLTSTASYPSISINAPIITDGGNFNAECETMSPGNAILSSLLTATNSILGSVDSLQNQTGGCSSGIFVTSPINTSANSGGAGGTVLLLSTSFDPNAGLFTGDLGFEQSTSDISIGGTITTGGGSITISSLAYINGVGGTAENLADIAESDISVNAPINAGTSFVSINNNANAGDAAFVSIAQSMITLTNGVSITAAGSNGITLDSDGSAGMASIISSGSSNIDIQGSLSSQGGIVTVSGTAHDSGQAILGATISQIDIENTASILTGGGSLDVSSIGQAGISVPNGSLASQWTQILGHSLESAIGLLSEGAITVDIAGNAVNSGVNVAGHIDTSGGSANFTANATSDGAEQGGDLSDLVDYLENLDVAIHGLGTNGISVNVSGIATYSSITTLGSIETDGGNVNATSYSNNQDFTTGASINLSMALVTMGSITRAGNVLITSASNAGMPPEDIVDEITNLANNSLDIASSLPDPSPSDLFNLIWTHLSGSLSAGLVDLNSNIQCTDLQVYSNVIPPSLSGTLVVNFTACLGGISLDDAKINAQSVFLKDDLPASTIGVNGLALDLTASLGGISLLDNSSLTTNNGGQEYDGPVDILGSVSLLDTGSGEIKFDSTIDGDGSLAVQTGSGGSVYFADNIGSSTALQSLEVTAPTIYYNGTTIRTTGNQAYNILGSPGSSNDAFSLSSTSPWINSGFSVQAGETITINASGTVYIGAQTDTSLDNETPNGQPSLSTVFNPPLPSGVFAAPGFPRWALVGRIGVNGTPFLVGDSLTFKPSVSGVLYLSIDDNDFFDNSGSWSVTVSMPAQSSFINLASDPTFTSLTGNIAFNGGLNGVAPITLNAGGDAQFTGAVGNLTPPANLTVNANSITAGNITTTGDISLNPDNTLQSGSSGTPQGSIDLNGDIVSTGGSVDLNSGGVGYVPSTATIISNGGSQTISAPAGSITVGQNNRITALGNLSINAQGQVTLGDVSTTGDLNVQGGQIVLLNRPSGQLTAANGQADLDTLLGISEDPLSFVVGGTINFSTQPTVQGSGAGPMFATGNGLGNVPGFSINTFLGGSQAIDSALTSGDGTIGLSANGPSDYFALLYSPTINSQIWLGQSRTTEEALNQGASQTSARTETTLMLSMVESDLLNRLLDSPTSLVVNSDSSIFSQNIPALQPNSMFVSDPTGEAVYANEQAAQLAVDLRQLIGREVTDKQTGQTTYRVDEAAMQKVKADIAEMFSSYSAQARAAGEQPTPEGFHQYVTSSQLPNPSASSLAEVVVFLKDMRKLQNAGLPVNPEYEKIFAQFLPTEMNANYLAAFIQ